MFLVLILWVIGCGPSNIEIKEEVPAPTPTKSTVGNITTPTANSMVPKPDYLNYSWHQGTSDKYRLINQVVPPAGFSRKGAGKGSLAEWFRFLPIKEDNSHVKYYNGGTKYNDVHYRIIDIDTGNRDLQQCADAVMRLKAEYHYSKKEFDQIHFDFTSGDEVRFDDWSRGKRPRVKGNSVTFSSPSGNTDTSYPVFRKYMNMIFNYAGTYSLSKELKKVNVRDMEIGDVFIQGGFPGHAVVVVDMVENDSGQRMFLLAQSYMPAQDIHILKNTGHGNSSPWYPLNFGETLYTPEWSFDAGDLKRFR